MKSLFTILLLCTSVMFANTEKNPNKKTDKNEGKEKNTTLVSRNFHSVKKWKMTIEFLNGEIISKTLTITEDSTTSAMEMAFTEAEKYAKTLYDIKSYQVAPISKNKYVLLAAH